MMDPARLHVDADLDVTVGAAHLRVRGSGPFLDVHLPSPRHWPSLWRASAPLRRALENARYLQNHSGLRIRACYGPFKKVVS